MQVADSRDGDPELLEIVSAIMKAHGKTALPVSLLVGDGPHGRTKLYEDINGGRLVTFVSSGRRFALVTDYARYLLLLKRQGALCQRPNPGSAGRAGATTSKQALASEAA